MQKWNVNEGHLEDAGNFKLIAQTSADRVVLFSPTSMFDANTKSKG